MATLKQKRALKMVEAGRNMGEVMRLAGYSPSTATHPKKLTESKAWQRLMQKHFPDSLLAKRHSDLLNKKEFIAIGKAGEREAVETGEVDANAVARGLDMAYKLKSKYPNRKLGNESDITSIEIQRVILRIRDILPNSEI